MKIIYEGELLEGTIKDGDSEFGFIKNRELEVPDALGKRLVAQGLWQEVKKISKRGGKNGSRNRC